MRGGAISDHQRTDREPESGRQADQVQPARTVNRLKAFLRAVTLFVLPTLVACLVFLEMGLRVTGRQPSNVTDGIFEQHGTSYRLRKNISKVSRTPSFSCTIDTNSFGFRDRAPGQRMLAGPYSAFVGDSITFGNGVDYDDSFVGVFARFAETRGGDVVNLAVGGHRLLQQEELLRDFMTSAEKKPSRVIIVFTPQLMAFFELRDSGVIVKQGYLFDRNSWFVPYLTVMLGNTSSSYCFFRDGVRRLQSRMFPSGSRGALEILEIFSKEAPIATPAVARRMEERLTEIDELVRRFGAKPIYVYMPTSADLRADEFLSLAGRRPEQYDFLVYYDLLRKHCEQAGIQLVNLLPALQAQHAARKTLSFLQDPHYNATANHLIGQVLYDSILGSAASAPFDGPLPGTRRDGR